jgi:hypothetical protein
MTDLVHLPQIIALALPDLNVPRARMAICHGTVYLDGECLGLPDVDIERDRLRDATILVGLRQIKVNAEATGVRRVRKRRKAKKKPTPQPDSLFT